MNHSQKKIKTETATETENMYTIPDLISFQRAVSNIRDAQLDQFVSKLDSAQVRWLLSRYLSTFLPHQSKNPKNPYPTINSVHLNRLNNINKNENDSSILSQMKQFVNNNYFNKISGRNSLSINTSQKQSNKCVMLKSIPKNLLSHIISFLHCVDRSRCCKTSYIMYQACNDPIAKQSIFLSSKLVRHVNITKNVDCEQISGFKKIEFESVPHYQYNQNWIFKKRHLSKLLTKCQYLQMDANQRYLLVHRCLFLSNLFLLSMKNKGLSKLKSLNLEFCPMFRYNAHQCLIGIFSRFESLLKKCQRLEKLCIHFAISGSFKFDIPSQSSLTIDKILGKLCRESISGLTSLNQCNLAFNLRYFEYDARFCTYAKKNEFNSLILPNIEYMVNLEVLKLLIAFPENNHDIDSATNINTNQASPGIVHNGGGSDHEHEQLHGKQEEEKSDSIFKDGLGQTKENSNKLSKLSLVDIMFYYSVTSLSGWSSFKSCIESPNHLPRVGRVKIPNNTRWNGIMLNIIEYILHIGGVNMKTFVLKCPQWTHDDHDIINVGNQSQLEILGLLNRYGKQLDEIDFAMSLGICTSMLRTAMDKWLDLNININEMDDSTNVNIISLPKLSETWKISLADSQITTSTSQVFAKLRHLSLVIGLQNICHELLHQRYELALGLCTTMMTRGLLQLESLS